MRKCWILRTYRTDYIDRDYFDSLDIAFSVARAYANAGLRVALLYKSPIQELQDFTGKKVYL